MQRFWDAHSSGWDKVSSAPDAVARRRDLVEALSSRLAAGARVVDLGCGAGHLATELALRGFQMTGADYSTAMLERARQRAADADVSLSLERVDLDGALPWPPDSFDAAVSSYVVQVVADPVAFVVKAAAIVRPGGTVVIEAPSRASDRSSVPTMGMRDRVFNEVKRATAKLPGGVIWYDAERLRREAEQAGLAVSSVDAHGPALRLIAATADQ